jgi:hypothetical protein
MYMNEYDLDFAVERFSNCALRRYRVALVVQRLADWTDRNSDGWAYWPKPARAARRAMEQIQSTTHAENVRQEEGDLTEEGMTAVLRPIRAFMTRQINEGRMTPAERTHILGDMGVLR